MLDTQDGFASLTRLQADFKSDSQYNSRPMAPPCPWFCFLKSQLPKVNCGPKILHGKNSRNNLKMLNTFTVVLTNYPILLLINVVNLFIVSNSYTKFSNSYMFKGNKIQVCMGWLSTIADTQVGLRTIYPSGEVDTYRTTNQNHRAKYGRPN